MSAYATMTKKATFMLTPEEHAWITQESERRQVSMASLVREWIHQAQQEKHSKKTGGRHG